MQVPTCAPADLSELQSRAQAIAGFTLGELADMAGIAIPRDFKRHKGWTGQLIETWLGCPKYLTYFVANHYAHIRTESIGIYHSDSRALYIVL